MFFLSLFVTRIIDTRAFILPGSLFLLCLAGTGPVMAQQIAWKVAQTHNGGVSTTHPPASTTYTVSEDITRIDSPLETVLIDYPAHRLFRLKNSFHPCLVFPFADPHGQLPLAQTRTAASGDRIWINGRACLRKTLHFGADLAYSQMLAPPVIQRYGQDFTITLISYSISDSLVMPEFLLALAQKRRQIFSDYPLLRQIDPVGILEFLQGFPLQSEQVLPGGRLLSTLEEVPHLLARESFKDLQPPQACEIMRDLP